MRKTVVLAMVVLIVVMGMLAISEARGLKMVVVPGASTLPHVDIEQYLIARGYQVTFIIEDGNVVLMAIYPKREGGGPIPPDYRIEFKQIQGR